VATKFPLPHEFQAVLVRFKDGDGSYYLNDTDQYARLGATSHEGKLGITLSDQSYGTIMPVRGDDSRIAVNFRMALDGTGKVRMGIRREYSGASYGKMNKFFSELPPEERNRYFQEAVSQVAQGARPVGGLRTDFGVYPGVEEFTVEIDHYAVVDGRYLYFDLPYAMRLFPAYTDRHTLPLFIRDDHVETIHTEIGFPAGFKRVVIAPKNESLTAPDGAGSFQVTAAEADGSWSATQELSARPSVVAPGDYGALLSIESSLENKSSRLLLLEQ
jgi:hypothetical protein